MQIFGLWSITWVVGAALFFLPALILQVRWLKYTRENWSQKPSSYGGLFSHLRSFMNRPNTGMAPFPNLRLAKFLLLGGLIVVVSMLVGDHEANQPCVQACRDAGWEDGRLRGNPHQARFDEYACWCQRGKKWSAKPIQISNPIQ